MRTDVVKSAPRAFRTRALCLAAAAAGLGAPAAHAGAPANAPQVLLAITNSESMDGTTAGAIMVGSGSYLPSSYSSLTNSSSPVNYTIPSGFVPPVTGAPAAGVTTAPWTSACSTTSSTPVCDNGPSRLNMTKYAIKNYVLAQYGSVLNFGIYTYANSSGGKPSATLYDTWVYYMSPSTSGFTFTNTASTTGGTVTNPCYQYSLSSTSSQVKSDCSSMVSAGLYTSSALGGNPYMNIGATSDNPLINDVLYAGTSYPAKSAFVTYGTVSPTNPYTYYGLGTYNTNIGGYSVGYSKTAPSVGGWSTTPTNAGYVPFSPQVMYAARGFGYGGSQSATTGYAAVAMGTDPTSSNAFNTALAPETSSSSTSEIKSFAGQSGVYALMHGALSYLSGVTHSTCQPQYVVLLTDGLPTLDHNGNAWPPLGTTTANAYSLTATYNTDGSFASSNSAAVTDTITAIKALATAGIKVYVIGLGAGVDPTVNASAANLLTAMALAGGTSNYFPATDTASLNNAFQTIVNQIYTASAVSAPVAPISVSNGSSYEYQLTSIPTPLAGHVNAYAVDANGTPSATSSWDAAALMTPTLRTGALMAPDSSGNIVTLANVDAAAFSLSATTCVPDTSTIINYTIDPNYSGGPCTYLGSRRSGWTLGRFSGQDTGRFVGPPGSSQLIQRYATYLSYTTSNASRTPMLTFTDNDGFLYAVNASTGALLWGWTSRPLLAKLQNYSAMPTSSATDGNFSVVDAMDATGTWGSYVVGSLQGGAEHFSFKLTDSGTPSTMVFDNVVSGGTVAGDTAGVTGVTPLRQPTVVAYIGNSGYMVYMVTTGSTSTLYESEITSGATTSAALSFKVSSDLWLDTSTNRLWFGGSNGTLWSVVLGSGRASTDLGSLQQIGTLVDPSSGNAVSNPLYVGYTEAGNAPRFYAMSASEIEMFNVTSTGWTPEWAATTSTAYAYSASASTHWSIVSGANTLTGGGVVSDMPSTIGTSLLVPMFVAGSGCNAGTGWYDFFDIATGKFPTSPTITYNGATITANYSPGASSTFTASAAFTPSVSFTRQGVVMNNGAKNCLSTNCGQMSVNSSYSTQPFSWRQH